MHESAQPGAEQNRGAAQVHEADRVLVHDPEIGGVVLPEVARPQEHEQAEEDEHGPLCRVAAERPEVLHDEHTRWPDRFNPEKHGAVAITTAVVRTDDPQPS